MKKIFHQLTATIMSTAIVLTLGSSFIRADGLSVEKGTEQITLTGSGTYTLEEDITIPIAIESASDDIENVTIYLNGHSITTDCFSGISGLANITVMGPGSIYTENEDAIDGVDVTVIGGEYTATGYIYGAYGNESAALNSSGDISISGGAVVTGPYAAYAFIGGVTATDDCTLNGKIAYYNPDTQSTTHVDSISEVVSSNAEENANAMFARIDAEAAAATATGTTTEVETTTTETVAAVDPEQANAFVERLYDTALSRTGDATGVEYWVNALVNGEKTGSEVAYGFFFSNEFINNGSSNEEYVKSLYEAILGRDADADGLAYWVDALNSGKTTEEVFSGFVASAEFADLCASYGITA